MVYIIGFSVFISASALVPAASLILLQYWQTSPIQSSKLRTPLLAGHYWVNSLGGKGISFSACTQQGCYCTTYPAEL